MLRFFLTLLIWGGFALSARAQTLTGISFDGPNVVLTLSPAAVKAPHIFPVGEGDPRIVIDFAKADLNLGGKTLTDGPQTALGQGHVKQIRFAARGEAGMRAVLDLKVGASLKNHKVVGETVIIALNGQSAMPAVKPVQIGPRYFEDSIPYPRLQPLLGRIPPRKPVIVIDPGHGGYDPGAIGVKGTKEKSVTSKAAKELQRQLIATGRYKVIVTRSRDVYIAHEERLRIARAGGADLFISIHADSTGSKRARGASVYTLADRAKNRSKKIVNTQNWIMDVDLTTQSDSVGDILVDLAQRKTASQSEQFADVLLSSLAHSTALIGNSHRRAGYFVLLAPDVPAVLLEMGFLSNPQDEKLLNSAAHRKKVLRSVTRAINIYFDNQNK